MGAEGVLRVVEREARVYRRMWHGLAFSTFVAPVLFLAAMGFGLGDLVDENSGTVDGLDYIDFIAPGLLIIGAAQIATGQSMWPVMGGMKWMRFYHGMVASPMQAHHVYWGHVIWEAIRSAISATAFVIVAVLFGAIPSAWAVLAIPVASLVGAAIAAPVSAFSATQESDVAFPIFFRLVLMPLILFSGVFFPIEQLPDWLEAVAIVTPVYPGVELARAATTGEFDVSLLGNIAVLLAYLIVGSYFGVRNYRRRLAP